MGVGEGGIIRTWRRGWRVLLVWDGEFRQSKHSSCTHDSTPILYRRRLRSRRQAVAATDKATVVHGRLQRLGLAVTVTGGHGEGGHGEGGPGDWSRRAARRIAGATAPRPRSTATRSSRAWSSASASSASAASSATGGAACLRGRFRRSRGVIRTFPIPFPIPTEVRVAFGQKNRWVYLDEFSAGPVYESVALVSRSHKTGRFMSASLS